MILGSWDHRAVACFARFVIQACLQVYKTTIYQVKIQEKTSVFPVEATGLITLYYSLHCDVKSALCDEAGRYVWVETIDCI